MKDSSFIVKTWTTAFAPHNAAGSFDIIRDPGSCIIFPKAAVKTLQNPFLNVTKVSGCITQNISREISAKTWLSEPEFLEDVQFFCYRMHFIDLDKQNSNRSESFIAQALQICLGFLILFSSL